MVGSTGLEPVLNLIFSEAFFQLNYEPIGGEVTETRTPIPRFSVAGLDLVGNHPMM